MPSNTRPSILKSDQRYHEENAIFHQDGATPHLAIPVRQFLAKILPGRLTGEMSAIASQSGYCLHIFLWKHLSWTIFITQSETTYGTASLMNANKHPIFFAMSENISHTTPCTVS